MLGNYGVRKFMYQRLVKMAGGDKPELSFTAKMTKINAPTFSNLFDIEKKPGTPQQQVVSANRKVLQRIVTAYQADRHIDMKEVARHEIMSVPLSLFNTDQTMRKGTKSILLDCIMTTADISCIPTIPAVPPLSSQHVVDGMGQVYKVNTSKTETFGDFAEVYCKSICAMPSARIDVIFDRYDGASIKDDTRSVRTSGSNAGRGKKKQKRRTIARAISPEVKLPNGADFKAFLTLKENKIALQQLLGEYLLQNSPRNKTIVVSGAFEDPLDVRASGPLSIQLEELESDQEEADTRIILSILHSTAPRCVVVARDTDVFILLLANYCRFINKQVYFLHGTTNEKKYLDIGAVAEALLACDVNLLSLPIFHALTGCDTTSFLYGIGKPTAWKIFLEHKVNPLSVKEL